MSSLWTTVAALLWLAINVSGQCLTSEQRATLKENAKETTKYVRNTAAVIGSLGTGLSADTLPEPFFTALSPVTNFITGLSAADQPQGPAHDTINCLNEHMANMTAKLDDIKEGHEELKKDIAEVKELLLEISEAIGELQDLVSDKFDTLDRKMELEVMALKEDNVGAFWQRDVTVPLSQLRNMAKTLLYFNFSRDAENKMAETCRRYINYEPYEIATRIWWLAASNCGIKNKKLQMHNTELELRGDEMPEICLPKIYIKNADSAPHSADRIYTFILGVMIELANYHAMCVGIVFRSDGPEKIMVENDKFVAVMTDIWDAFLKFILETVKS